MIDSWALPPSTNFAGGGDPSDDVMIGHSRLYRLKIGWTLTRSMCASW